MHDFLSIRNLHFFYGEFQALAGVSLTAPAGSCIALLGPNGSGKTTLFRLLAGLATAKEGEYDLFGLSYAQQGTELRQKLGIVFQSPSLDKKLSVEENLTFQGQLYGLRGASLKQRIKDLAGKLRIDDRLGDKVNELSGGLARRVELARCLLHSPQGVLLDEPSTGLDPTSRMEFWDMLQALREQEGLSIAFTTHWFEEADRADLVGILDTGNLVAWGKPDELCADLGHDIVTVKTRAEGLADALEDKFKLKPVRRGSALRVSLTNGEVPVGELVEFASAQSESVQVSKPTLEDVYMAKTGHAFEEGEV